MGTKAGLALKSLQWFIRGVQLGCAAVVLALFSYFMATLSNRNFPIADWLKAVEGISGIAVVYTIAALLLLCCFAGLAVTSFIAIVLDVAFIGGFIFIAWANRGGAGSCNGVVSTPYGTADADTNIQPNGDGGFTSLPSFRQACRMQTACFAVSIVAVFFFIFSAFVEVTLARNHRKEKRFGPSPKNDYTSGSGKRRGFFGRRNKSVRSQNTNVLPHHTHPDAVRDSYATESTAVSGGAAGLPPHTTHAKVGEPGYGHHQPAAGVVDPVHYPEGNYQRY